jgi:hypothetical protein
MSEALAQRRVVENALQRVRSGTNDWEIVSTFPKRGAIGFVLQRPLYDYLVDPRNAPIPRGSAAFCIFHKNYKPPADRKLWQIDKERYAAYQDEEQNVFLDRVEKLIGGTPRILYARGMEVGCTSLLYGLGYEINPLSGAGKKQSGIDLVAVISDPEEENDKALAIECKTTAQGFQKGAVGVFFRSVMASLRKSRNKDAVRAAHPLINEHDGNFDYLVVSNRAFRSPKLQRNEGYFILRGMEIE